jgi:hypothetical protein
MKTVTVTKKMAADFRGLNADYLLELNPRISASIRGYMEARNG